MKMEPVEQEEYKGYTVKVYHDADGNNPRDDDNLGIMTCFHRRYNLGDRNGGLRAEDFSGWGEVEVALKAKGHMLIAPLYLYDHSGLRIKIGSFDGLLPQGHAEFDSGQVGFISTTKERIRAWRRHKRVTKKAIKWAEAFLEGEVEQYDDYLSGNVYGYVIEGPDGEDMDSCWGYYPEHTPCKGGGPLEYMMRECRSLIDGYVEDDQKEAVVQQNVTAA